MHLPVVTFRCLLLWGSTSVNLSLQLQSGENSPDGSSRVA
jgi:hypothetical protein